MFVPVNLWSQTAEILELRADAPFMSGLWRFISSLTVKAGFVLPPWVYLVMFTVLGAGLYWWFLRRQTFLAYPLALFVWGALFADTPFVLIVVALAEIIRERIVKHYFVNEIVDEENPPPMMPITIPEAVSTFVLGAVLLITYNVFTCGASEYVVGWYQGAKSDLRAVFNFHPVDEWQARAIVKDYAKGVAEELGNCKWFFSDGACDDGVRIYAAENGNRPQVISVIGGKKVEVQQLTRYEDQAAIADGGMALLKSWVENDREDLKVSAVQTGFGIWRAKNRALPHPGAYMAFCDGVGRDAISSTNMPERVFDFYANGGKLENLSPEVCKMFVSVHWRLARMAQLRGEWYDQRGEAEKARKEMDLADRLDVVNPEAKKAFKEFDRLMTAAQLVRTPREGLDFALKTANFALAHLLAKTILVSEPDDVKANFAAGMDYLMRDDFALAEQHFRVVLKTRPNDPIILNNLAVTLYNAGKREEALKCAEAALKEKPDSAEIKGTLRTILNN